MVRAVTAVGALVFAMLVGVSAALLLEPCGVRFGPDRCPATDRAAGARLAALDGANADLRHEVLQLERDLALMQCAADPPPDVPPDATPPALPAPAPVAPPIDQEAWRRGDLGALDGCWLLDSDYRTQNDSTGAITHFTEWTMCFAAGGRGEATMRATNGTTCAGPVTGDFATGGRLVVTEGGNLACSDGTFIYRRVLGCALDPQGGAQCTVDQPQVGRSSTVLLRRAASGTDAGEAGDAGQGGTP